MGRAYSRLSISIVEVESGGYIVSENPTVFVGGEDRGVFTKEVLKRWIAIDLGELLNLVEARCIDADCNKNED